MTTPTTYHRIDADVRRDIMAGTFVTIDGVTHRVSVFGDGTASTWCEVERQHVTFRSEDAAIEAICGQVVTLRKVRDLRRGAGRRLHLHDDPCGAAELRERADATLKLAPLVEQGGAIA